MTEKKRLFRLTGREPAPSEDIAAEFEAHLQHKVDALIQQGRSPAEARREAELEFGSLERFARECRVIDGAERRERRRREWAAGIAQEFRHAARAVFRSPGFAITAVLVMAAGIGLNVTIFSLLRGVVLRPLPYPAPRELVAVYASNPKDGWSRFTVSPADFYDWEREVKSFQAMVAYNNEYAVSTGRGPAEQVPVLSVTRGFHAVTGQRPASGRPFTESDFATGAPRVALLSHATWVTRFGSDAGVVGQRWTLDGESYEIVGVMPPGFRFPVQEAAAWLPFRTPSDLAGQRGAHYLTVAARLAPGATIETAQTELTALTGRIAIAFPRWSTNWTATLVPLHEDLVEEARPTIVLLMTGATLLLVLACANVASLVLVRSVRRSGEVAVRSALGAGRGRLLWHAASEVLVVVLLGAMVSLPLARLGVGAVRRFAPDGVPRIEAVSVDGMSLLFTLGATLTAALLVGLAPARRIGRMDLREGISRSGRHVAGRRGVQRWLVGVETAMALALLAVAGVLLKSKERLEAVNPGFRPGQILTASVSLPDQTYGKSAAILQFQDALLRRVRALPGVTRAGLVVGLPLSGYRYSSSFTIDSVPVPDGVSQSAQLRLASPDYFAILGIPIKTGRGFAAEDRRDGHPVVVISETAAKKFWPGGDFLGRFVRVDAQPGPEDDRPQGYVVGVAGDVLERGLDREPQPIVYALAEQVAVSYFTIVVEAGVAPLSLAPLLRRELTALDPDLPLSQVRPMAGWVREASAPQRFRAWVMGFFALLAAGLAAFGIYGVVSHIVAQRTREIGLRRALGASDHQVVKEVVRAGMRDAAMGAAVGLGLGWVITRQLTHFLFRVAPADPPVLAVSLLLFLGVTLAACWIPARRASRADPALVLRGE